MYTSTTIPVLSNTIGKKFGDVAPLLYTTLRDNWIPTNIHPPTFHHVYAELCNHDHPNSMCMSVLYEHNHMCVGLSLADNVDIPITEIVIAYLIHDDRFPFQRLFILGKTATGYRASVYNNCLLSDDLPEVSAEYLIEDINVNGKLLQQVRNMYHHLTTY